MIGYFTNLWACIFKWSCCPHEYGMHMYTGRWVNEVPWIGEQHMFNALKKLSPSKQWLQTLMAEWGLNQGAKAHSSITGPVSIWVTAMQSNSVDYSRVYWFSLVNSCFFKIFNGCPHTPCLVILFAGSKQKPYSQTFQLTFVMTVI